MKLIKSLLGKGGEATAEPIKAIGNIVDELFTSKEEKLNAEQLKLALLQKPDLIQTEINKIESTHRKLFVAGWRPSIGWVCSISLLYNYVIRDLINYILSIYYPDVELLPALQMEHLMTILLGMLGMGGLRTIEKLNNKTK